MIGPRPARWLLMSHGRAHGDHFQVTQEFLACMLGVRRVGITVAAGVLQRQVLIAYHRGELTVLNRAGLEAASCSCYRADRMAYADLFCAPPAGAAGSVPAATQESGTRRTAARGVGLHPPYSLSYKELSPARLRCLMNNAVSNHEPPSTARAGSRLGLRAVPSARANHLLAALPDADWARMWPQLEAVDLPLGHVVCESGQRQTHVYFPTTAIVSLLYVMEDGSSAEIAVVGSEGVVGVSAFMGGDSAPSRSVVQSAGQGVRLKAEAIKREFDQSGPVVHLMLRYTQALITQVAQTAVCNRHHTLDKQLCRWLLLSLDRLQGNELVMTHERIANMLGVRREGVTEAALKLQLAGLIRYTRGRITVTDRPGLERRTCECYAVVKKEYERLLPARVAQ